MSAEAVSLAQVLATDEACTFDVEEHVLSALQGDHLTAIDEALPAQLAGGPPGLREDIASAVCGSVGAAVSGYAALKPPLAFEQLPIIGKAEVIDDRFRYVNRELPLTDLWCASTFGTTGAPATFFYSPEFYFEQLLLTVPKLMLRAGVSPRPTDRSLSVNVTDVRSSGNRVVIDPRGTRPPMIQVHVPDAEAETAARCLKRIARLRPTVVSSRSELFAELLAGPEPASVWGDYRPACLVSSGSEIGPAMRSRLEAAFDAPVINAYALTEFGLAASECGRGTGMHLEYGVVAEVVDDHGAVLAPGATGELVLSSVRNRAMPLVRYRTGDRAVLTEGRCACGYAGVSVARLEGRAVPLFRLPSGATVSPSHLNELHARFALAQFQITQHTVDRFSIAIEPRDPDAPIDDLLARVAADVRQALGGEVTVTAEARSFTYGRTKFTRFRSLLAEPADG